MSLTLNEPKLVALRSNSNTAFEHAPEQDIKYLNGIPNNHLTNCFKRNNLLVNARNPPNLYRTRKFSSFYEITTCIPLHISIKCSRMHHTQLRFHLRRFNSSKEVFYLCPPYACDLCLKTHGRGIAKEAFQGLGYMLWGLRGNRSDLKNIK